MPKNVQTTAQLCSFHMLASWCSKPFKLGFSSTWTEKFSASWIRKGRGTRYQIAIIYWIIEKAREFQKTSIFALLTTLKPLTMWIIINCGKFFKRSIKYLWFNRDWLNIGKKVHQGCILSLCLFNLYAEYIMRNAGLDEAQAGIKIAGRNSNNLRYADDTTLM